MSAHVARMESLLLSWKDAVIREAHQALGLPVDTRDPALYEPSEQSIKERAAQLGGDATLHTVKKVIVANARKTQVQGTTLKMEHAALVSGYPRSLFHVCTTDEASSPH